MDHPYRISTITTTGSVNTEINLDLFYEILEVCDEEDDKEGVLYVEYGKKKSDTVYKGFCKKFLVKRRKKNPSKKRFDNQVTVIYKKQEGDSYNLINIKVFKNGNVQMTGVKYIEQGEVMVEILVGIIRSMCEKNRYVVANCDAIKNERYMVRLINSDFKIGFEINRRALHMLCTNELEHDCSYEPCIYPGVMLQYFCNTTNLCQDGLCHCTKRCYIGKGSGVEDCQCKKVTISIFQSGSIIITGAHNHAQIDEVYNFITKFVLSFRNEIEKKKIVVEAPKEKKIVYIKKSSIREC